MKTRAFFFWVEVWVSNLLWDSKHQKGIVTRAEQQRFRHKSDALSLSLKEQHVESHKEESHKEKKHNDITYSLFGRIHCVTTTSTPLPKIRRCNP
jgi:hypothetical protein